MGVQFKQEISMPETEPLRKRHISISFSVRSDLLEELERRVEKGRRSAFLENLLVRELGRKNAAAQA
jgi:hypothetical protein